MARLLADLEQIERFYGDQDPRKEILRHCLALEMAGFDGVLIGVEGDFDPSRVRILETVRQSVNIGLSVSAPPEKSWIESLQDIKPSMVLFDFQQDQSERLSEFITRLQVEDILIGFQVSDDIELIKKAARLKADYLVLNCDSYCLAKTTNMEIEELNKIVKLSSLAGKLSMGIIAKGDFEKRQMKRLNDTGVIEEFILGSNFLSDSLLYGYSTAIRNIRSSII